MTDPLSRLRAVVERIEGPFNGDPSSGNDLVWDGCQAVIQVIAFDEKRSNYVRHIVLADRLARLIADPGIVEAFVASTDDHGGVDRVGRMTVAEDFTSFLASLALDPEKEQADGR